MTTKKYSTQNLEKLWTHVFPPTLNKNSFGVPNRCKAVHRLYLFFGMLSYPDGTGEVICSLLHPTRAICNMQCIILPLWKNKTKPQNKVLNGIPMLRVGLRNCRCIYYHCSSVFVLQKSLLNHLKEGNAQNHTTNHSCNMIPSVQVKGLSSAGCNDHTELCLPNFFKM